MTLHGLVLVARRVVDFGPLEPRLSRSIFIHQALVKGEFRTAAPFFEHNRRLVEEVRQIEAKARRRDVLVDEERSFRFYDARVPHRVYDGYEFEKWRRQAERHNERLLFMGRSDLMLHGAEGVTAELYPDRLDVEGVTVPLQYRFDPGHPADGVTAIVPLAALNQFRPTVRMARAGLPAGEAGRADPLDAEAVARAVHPGAGVARGGRRRPALRARDPCSTRLRWPSGGARGAAGADCLRPGVAARPPSDELPRHRRRRQDRRLRPRPRGDPQASWASRRARASRRCRRRSSTATGSRAGTSATCRRAWS